MTGSRSAVHFFSFWTTWRLSWPEGTGQRLVSRWGLHQKNVNVDHGLWRVLEGLISLLKKGEMRKLGELTRLELVG